MSDAVVPEYIRRAIYGEMTLEEKRAAVDKSTTNWWREYSARKNDEEEEHVADTLLYDERCHLPRTAPRPDVVPDYNEVTHGGAQTSPALRQLPVATNPTFSNMSAAPATAAATSYPPEGGMSSSSQL